MGLIDFLFGFSDLKSKWDNETEDDCWFEHSGEEHDTEDGYCPECDDDEESLEG